MIYLDYSATTPMSKKAVQVYVEAAEEYFGNPSSLHDEGHKAAMLLEASRKKLTELVGGDARGIYYTSGGSESNDLAIRSIAYALKDKGGKILTTELEHPSVLNTMKLLQSEGFEVSYIPVDRFGRIELQALEAMLTPDTILASIHYANAEIGTVQDVAVISKMLREKDIVFHSDCVQAFGKIELKAALFDSFSVSSHKVYGPKGVGLCYISPAIRWQSLFEHVSHERGLRQGTVNLPGIVSFAAAAEETMQSMSKEQSRLAALRDQLLAGLQELPLSVHLEGHPTHRLPQHLGLRIQGIEGQYLLLECNRYGIAISTGTACTAGQQEPSSTMKGIGKTKQEADEFIRITLGKHTTAEEITQCVQTFQEIVMSYMNKKGYHHA